MADVVRPTEEQMEVLRELGLVGTEDKIILTPHIRDQLHEEGIAPEEVNTVAQNYAYVSDTIVRVVDDDAHLFASEVRDYHQRYS